MAFTKSRQFTAQLTSISAQAQRSVPTFTRVTEQTAKSESGHLMIDGSPPQRRDITDCFISR